MFLSDIFFLRFYHTFFKNCRIKTYDIWWRMTELRSRKPVVTRYPVPWGTSLTIPYVAERQVCPKNPIWFRSVAEETSWSKTSYPMALGSGHLWELLVLMAKARRVVPPSKNSNAHCHVHGDFSDFSFLLAFPFPLPPVVSSVFVVKACSSPNSPCESSNSYSS